MGLSGEQEQILKRMLAESELADLEEKLRMRGVHYRGLPKNMQDEWWAVQEFADVGEDHVGAKEWLENFINRIDAWKASGHA